MKITYEYLISSYTLLDDVKYNYLIMTVILFLAFVIAKRAVGWLYDRNYISTPKAGSLLHWIIRSTAFLFIFYLAATLIRIYNFIVGIPYVVWSILLLLLLGTAVIYFVIELIKTLKGSETL